MKKNNYLVGQWSVRNRISLRSYVVGLSAVFLVAPCAFADDFLDEFRKLDLNDFTLGGFLHSSSSYYEGIDDTLIVFPAPTTFGNAVSTNSTFFTRDGDFGLRAQFANGWDLGAIASIQTLGYGSGQSPTLAGMNRRDWTVQAGASVGRNFGGFRIDAMAQTDVLDEHGGQEYTSIGRINALLHHAHDHWKDCLVHFAFRAPREPPPHPSHCPENPPSVARFPAQAHSQSSRHPVETVSGRNMGEAIPLN